MSRRATLRCVAAVRGILAPRCRRPRQTRWASRETWHSADPQRGQSILAREQRLGTLAIVDVREQHIPPRDIPGALAQGLPSHPKPTIDRIGAPYARIEIVRHTRSDRVGKHWGNARHIFGMDDSVGAPMPLTGSVQD